MRSFNAIGNANFEVDQRKVGAAIAYPAGATSSGWAQDRWTFGRIGTGTAAVTVQQAASAGGLLWPGTSYRVSANFLAITLTAQQAALAAGDYIYAFTYVEGPKLRELISDVHSISLLVLCTQPLSFAVTLRNNASNYSLCKLCTISTANVWTLITLPNLPLWTSSTSWPVTPGNVGYSLAIGLAIGSTFTPPANDAWVAGNFIGAVGMTNFASLPVNTALNIALVQHEPGAVCSGLIDSPFNQNYDECLRYYQKTYDYGVAAGAANSAGSIGYPNPLASSTAIPGCQFPKTLAKTGTVTIYNPLTGAINSVVAPGGAATAVSAVNFPGQKGFNYISLASAVPAGVGYLHYVTDTGW
jgi:hypothetical protein